MRGRHERGKLDTDEIRLWVDCGIHGCIHVIILPRNKYMQACLHESLENLNIIVQLC